MAAARPQPATGVHQVRPPNESRRALNKRMRDLAAAEGLDLSGAELRKLLRNFALDGNSVVDLRQRLRQYADPTATTAIRNVMRAEVR